MCGIAGLVFNSKFEKGEKVNPSELEDLIKSTENTHNANHLLDKCWQYKSNINFIRYFRNKKERDAINELGKRILNIADDIIQKIDKIDKRTSLKKYNEKYKQYENILDCHWFLTREINQLYNKTLEYVKGKKDPVQDQEIIFYKKLNLLINSIDNRLEIRGRDSLGLSIQITLKKSKLLELNNFLSNDQSEMVYIEESKQNIIVTFVFKTANKIGSLGDNAKKIRDLIRQNKSLQLVTSSKSNYFATMLIHTRWASVGKVNVNNCHPVINTLPKEEYNYPPIFTVLNGDIHNYKDILDQTNQHIDEKSTSDSYAVPYKISELNNLGTVELKKILKQFRGSFVLAFQSSKNPGELVVAKQGSQGLYLGYSNETIMLASDVYGLVESCRYFFAVESGVFTKFSAKTKLIKNSYKQEFISLNDEKKVVRLDNFKNTNITTRDIDKKNYKHFLQKEISETNDIIQRTIYNYFQNIDKKSKNRFSESFIIDENQVPKFILKKLINSEFKKIIITGMGTCYTAAAAIAIYMRNMLRDYYPNIEIEPHVASEGSAFYLQPNMNDTLVIVIAQSGTTIDTNVYVQMAKERGAFSLAIANKREGDVTFLVDGTLYIGSGRDIEIAVPSTKTYTAQVILGYILTLYFCAKSKTKRKSVRKKLIDNINNLYKTPQIIKSALNSINDKDLIDALNNKVQNYNSWYVLHDNSPNSVCAMEIRIKFSEGCYHSLPFMHINDINNFKISNSLLFYITNSKISNVEKDIYPILKNDNSLIIVSNDGDCSTRLSNYIKNGKFNIIKINKTEDYYSFIPTIIIGQLLSYYAAVILDKRKKYFADLISSIDEKTKFKSLLYSLKKDLLNGHFNESYSLPEFIKLFQLGNDYLNNITSQNQLQKQALMNILNNFYQFSIRPIDTIKHQAKTITVGAIRSESTVGFNYDYTNLDKTIPITKDNQNINKLLNTIKSNGNSIEGLMDSSDNFVVLNDIDETFGNFFINILNTICKKHNINKYFKIARHYDLRMVDKWEGNNWLFFSKNQQTDLSSYDNKNKIIFNFNDKSDLLNIKANKVNLPLMSDSNSINITLNFILAAYLLIKTIIKPNEEREFRENNYLKKLYELDYCWNYILYNESLVRDIRYAAMLMLTKRHWKCIGSGVNYNSAKFAAHQLIYKLKRSCAFDILENHKHIDISAEAAVITFIANIWRSGYQNDILPEIDKLVAHSNLPIIITNKGDNRFEKMLVDIDSMNYKHNLVKIPTINIPKISESFSFLSNIIITDVLIRNMQELTKDKNVELLYKNAIAEPSTIGAII